VSRTASEILYAAIRVATAAQTLRVINRNFDGASEDGDSERGFIEVIINIIYSMSISQ
jgi:hypothetical protein